MYPLYTIDPHPTAFPKAMTNPFVTVGSVPSHTYLRPQLRTVLVYSKNSCWQLILRSSVLTII